MTGSELIQAFLHDLRGATSSPATLGTYQTSARQFHEYLRVSGIKLEQIKPFVLKDFAGWLGSRELSPRSINTWMIGAHRYLKFLAERGLVPQVEYSRNRSLRIPRTLQPTPTDKQVSLYLRAVAEHPEPFRTAMFLIPFCGLRRQELCHLKLDQVLYDPHGQRFTFQIMGKGAKERLVPLLRLAHDAFKNYLVGWRRHVKATHGWVFPGERSCGISHKGLASRIDKISRQLGIPHLSSHSLRRFYAHYLQEKMGLDVTDISKILGHESVETTLLYLRQDQNRLAVAKLARKEDERADQPAG